LGIWVGMIIALGHHIWIKNKLMRLKKNYWNDAKYARWVLSDIDLCQLILERLEKQLEKYKDKNVIFVNDFVPYERFISFKVSVKSNPPLIERWV
jgi:hypothetical protein